MQKIEINRDDLETALGKLYRRRGEAALAGKPTAKISNEIAGKEAEIAALGDAEATLAAQEREDAETQRQQRLAEMRRQLGQSVETVLDRVARAEDLLRSYADEMAGITSEYQEIGRLCHLISGEPVPTPASPSEVSSRFGCRMAAVMRTHSHRLGPLQWPQTYCKPADQWHAGEMALLDRHVLPLTKGND